MKIRLQTYLPVLAISVIFFVLYFGLLKQPRNYAYLFNSDFLHIVFFSESLFQGLSNLPYWYTTPTPYLFPDLGLFGLIRWMTGSRESTYLIALFLNFLFLNIGLYRLHRLFFPENRLFHLSVLVLFNGIMLGLLSISQVDFLLYLNQFAPVNHLGAFICVCLFLRTQIPAGYTYVLWLFGILVASVSDPVFVIYFLPIQFLLTYKKNTGLNNVIIVAICLCGFILFKALYATEILKTTSSESPGFRSTREAWLALPRIIVRLWDAPSFWVLAGLWLSALAALFFPIKHKLALFYFIFCVPWLVNVLGYFMSEDTLRYISGSLFFGIFMGISVFLYPLFSYLEKKTTRFSATLSVCLGAIILFVIKQQQNYFYLYTPDYIREIEEFTKKNRADYVITDYWNARPVSFFTKGIKAVPVTKELYFYCHEADIRLYDSIMAIKDPKIALYTSNFDLDSLSVYRDYSFPAVPCFQDSLLLLNRNPIRGK